MKRKIILALVLLGSMVSVKAQTVSTRTNSFVVDFSDSAKLVNTLIPVINWISPSMEIDYTGEAKYKIKIEIESASPIKNITIQIKDSPEASSRGSQKISPQAEEKHHIILERNITLMEGNNILEIEAENMDGVRTKSFKTVKVGNTALADATKLDRTDRALIFATDQYDNWPDLINPVFDSRTIAEELKKTYGFQVEMLENATQNEILKKLREYIEEKKYKPLDQLLIFFAGHGNYDAAFGEGYLVPKEALANDEGKTSYLSYNRLRSVVNNIPCQHIFLTMDVCFGGTFDQALASSRGMEEEVYREKSAAEFITMKLTYKTRKYLTSGGKQYVSDGIPGQHSPFARAFIEALRSKGGKDGILTLNEITPFVEKLKISPRAGEFGDNAPGSDFIFIVHY